MLIWKNSYSIGIQLIDIQHKHLFHIGNQAYSLLENDLQTDNYDAINLIVEDLRSYAKYHLTCEENYMLKINYSGYAEQKKEHDYFIIQNEVLGIIGTGIKEDEAEQSFSEEFDHIYRLLNGFNDESLTERNKQIKTFINYYVEKIEK